MSRARTIDDFIHFMRHGPREETLEDYVRALSTAVWAGDKEAADKARERIAEWGKAHDATYAYPAEPLVEVEVLETRDGRERRAA